MISMPDLLRIYAAGTSEGAEKGWDTRGRGGKRFGVQVTHPGYNDGNPFIHKAFDTREEAQEHADNFPADHPEYLEGGGNEHLMVKVVDRNGSAQKVRAAGTSEGAEKGWDARGRTGNVLNGHGWFKYGGREQDAYGHRIHKGHAIFVNKDGSWVHQQSVQASPMIDRAKGSDAASLNTHLLNYNWGGKTGRHGVGGR